MTFYFPRIEYTDFFGRTRKCLKTDLEFFKKRDQRIEKEIGPPPSPPPEESKQINHTTLQQFVKEGTNSEEVSELVSSDMRREQLRLKWEEEERKLAERTDIHYEDIRFDGKNSIIFKNRLLSNYKFMYIMIMTYHKIWAKNVFKMTTCVKKKK